MRDDYCVYARSILGRLDAIGNPTTGFNADLESTARTSSGSSSEMNLGLVMVAAVMLVMLVTMMLQKKKKAPLSKIE